MRRCRYVAPASALAALALLLAGCGGDDPDAAPTEPASSAPSTPATTAPSAPESSPTGSASDGTGLPAGGTAGDPTVLEATDDLLSWSPVQGPVERSVTRAVTDGGDWTLTVGNGSGSATLRGPKGTSTISAKGRQVSDALIDGHHAVVVLQDREQTRPSVAKVFDLGTGKSFELDGSSDVPTVNGGTWALRDDTLLHATVAKGAYCLASVDLKSQTSTLGYCAPKRHGFNAAHLTAEGDSLLTFDDSQPSCRTIVSLDGTETTPFEGVPDCKGWEGIALDDGAVWSMIPKERQTERAHYYARVGDGYYDLGPGTASTLTWCDGAAYFVRDPQQQGAPAALMRWSPDDGLAVVYQSPKGQAFLDQPRCGGDTMTVTALTSSGDEQVTADLS